MNLLVFWAVLATLFALTLANVWSTSDLRARLIGILDLACIVLAALLWSLVIE